ncbi:MAG: HigA family addiction module antidote protein [Deinococcus sp.]|nr:HigA family addiction module antidote protein [Deinococcus sp.]
MLSSHGARRIGPEVAIKGDVLIGRVVAFIVNEQAGISPEMAMRLAKAFQTTPQVWLNLQQQYELWQAQAHTDVSQVAVFTEAPR